MRVRTAILLCALVGACAHGEAGRTPVADVDGAMLRALNACGQTRPWTRPSEAALIAATGGKVHRDGRTLNVGSAKLTDDLSDSGKHVEYTYYGRLTEAPFDLVRLALYEGEAWAIVDDRGLATVLGGAPLISPDHSTIAVLANRAPHTLSAATIYRLRADGPARVFDMPVPPPCGGYWEGEDVAFKVYPGNWEGEPDAPLTPAGIVRDGEVWRYDGPVALDVPG